MPLPVAETLGMFYLVPSSSPSLALKVFLAGGEMWLRSLAADWEQADVFGVYFVSGLELNSRYS